MLEILNQNKQISTEPHFFKLAGTKSLKASFLRTYVRATAWYCAERRKSSSNLIAKAHETNLNFWTTMFIFLLTDWRIGIRVRRSNPDPEH
jgi:hypothetical protein